MFEQRQKGEDTYSDTENVQMDFKIPLVFEMNSPYQCLRDGRET